MREYSVVLAEDDARICQITARFIERVEGFELVGIGQTFAEAEDMISAFRPDLVLLDMSFPDGDGAELLQLIRRSYLNTDVICITADKDVATFERAIRVGVFDYILKPMIFRRFEEALKRFFEHRQKLSEAHSLEQADVDRIISTGHPKAIVQSLPKGIDALTLDKVECFLRELSATSVSAEELGQQLGISRTTARRYLEFLVSKGVVSASLEYGSVGRPERRYFR